MTKNTSPLARGTRVQVQLPGDLFDLHHGTVVYDARRGQPVLVHLDGRRSADTSFRAAQLERV